jgi:hypothetical protein
MKYRQDNMFSGSREKKLHAMESDQASYKKIKGHEREKDFNSLFGDASAKINYSGSSADCLVCNIHLRALIKERLGVDSFEVSLKGGVTTQIHLGWIDELTQKSIWDQSLCQIVKPNGRKCTSGSHGVSFEKQKEVLTSSQFWEKYLGKGSLLVYTDDEKYWWFFSMKDVINFIVKNFTWRLLETGRIKGDFLSKKQIFTYEYRPESHKKTFVLGAHGGQKGKELRDLLINNIKLIQIEASPNSESFNLLD